MILIATSAPARAASLPTGSGLVIQNSSAVFDSTWWDATAAVELQAVVVSTNLVNTQVDFGAPPPDTVDTFVLTFAVPVGNLTTVRWGLNSNNEGVNGAGWSVSGTPGVSGGVFTATFIYTGAITLFGSVQPVLWVEADANSLTQPASVTSNAHHLNGDTSTSSAAPVVIVGNAGDPP